MVARKTFLSLFFIVLLASSIVVSQAYAETIFSDGFESGNFNAWTATEGSTSPTVETTYKHHGTYAMRSNPVASDQEDVYKSGLTSTAVMYVREYVYFAANLPSSSGADVIFSGVGASSWQNAVFAVIFNSGTGGLYWGIQTYINGTEYRNYESSASNPTTGRWYCVELVRDVTNGRSKLYVDGTLKVDVARSHSGNSNMIWAGIGFVSYNGCDMYTDCVVAADAYIGPETTGTAYTQTISENLKTLDTPTRYASFTRLTTETVRVTDVASKYATFLRFTSENINIFDAASKYAAFMQFTSETVTVTDSTTTLTYHALLQLISETLHVADAFTKSGAFTRVLPEALRVLDNPLASAVFNRAVAELLNILDALAHLTGVVLGETLLTDSAFLSDGVTLQVTTLSVLDVLGVAALAFIFAVAAIALAIIFMRRD